MILQTTVIQIIGDTAYFILLMTIYLVILTLIALGFLWFNKWMSQTWMKKFQSIVDEFKKGYAWIPEEAMTREPTG